MRWRIWGGVGCVIGGLGLTSIRVWQPFSSSSRFPAATPASAAQPAPAPPAGPVRLVAVGDLMLGSPARVTQLLEAPREMFRPYRKLLEGADIAFGNLETPISTRGTPTPGKSQESLRNRTNFIFRAPPAAVEGLTWAGFDLVSVANNHAMDYGATALADTLKYLEKAEIGAIGGGTNLEEALAPEIVERNGQRFAFLAISDVLPLYSPAGENRPGIAPARGSWFEERMPEAIAEARKQADWVLVSVHWGKEKFTGATPKQRKLGHRLVDWGADVVIGHHTHCLGPVEHYEKGLIHYSLGNFIGPRARNVPSPAWEITFEPGAPPVEKSHLLE